MAIGGVGLGGAAAAAAVVIRPPGFDNLPDALNADDFINWSTIDQNDYLALHGSGTPPSVVIGLHLAQHILATLASLQGVPARVDVELLPPEFEQAGTTIDIDKFLNWSATQQLAYVTAHTTVAAPTVRIGIPGAPQIDAKVNVLGTGVDISYKPPTTAPSALDPRVFLSWNPGTQRAYVDLKGSPVTIGDPTTGPQILVTATGAAGVSVLDLPPEFGANPDKLDMNTFLDWSVALQLAYVTPRVTVLQPLVQIGLSGQPQIKVGVNANGLGVSIAYVAPADALATLDVRKFLSWSAGTQLAYVKANGAAVTPNAIVVGTVGGDRIRATVDPTGKSLNIVALPPDFDTAHDKLDAATFLKWQPDQQLLYVQLNGGSPLKIGIAATAPNPQVEPQVTATINAAGTLDFTYLVPSTVPAALDATKFLAWSPAHRAAYVQANGVGNPKAAAIGIPGQQQILATLQASGTLVDVEFLPAAFNTLSVGLSASQFLSFSPAAQLAYVLLNTVGGPPRTLTLPIGPPQVTATTNADLSAITLTYPAPNFDPATLDPVTFVGWPLGSQLAYVNAKGGAGSPKSVTLTTGPHDLTATLSADGKSLTFDSYWAAILPKPAPAPSNVSPGESQPIPYFYLPGSDVGTTSPQIQQGAEALFPTLDGVNNTLAVPLSSTTGLDLTDFNKAPADIDPSKFLGAHSAQQLEYVKKNGTAVTLSDGSVVYKMTIGANFPPPPDPNNGKNQVNVVTSVLPNRIYIVNQLQKSDFATMPRLDQEAIAGLTAFSDPTTGLAIGLGLSTDRAVINGLIKTANDNIAINSGLYQTTTVTNADGTKTTTANTDANGNYIPISPAPANNMMTLTDANIFFDEVKNMAGRVSIMNVFSQNDINNSLNEITTRFKRASAFAQTPNEVQDSVTSPYTATWSQVSSLDSNASVKSGYQVFIQQEKQILAIDNDKIKLANTGMLKNKKLDVPALVFAFQLDYDLSVEAKSRAATEEVNQTNELLKTYSAMQKIINDTLKSDKFNVTKDADKVMVGILGSDDGSKVDSSNAVKLDVQTMKIISMFNSTLGGSNYASAGFTSPTQALNPIERLKGLPPRPTDAFFNGLVLNPTYKAYIQTHWNTFATQLSDQVNLINQDNQIKMNDINSLDKEKSRHFDLANSALQKMADMIQNIARAE